MATVPVLSGNIDSVQSPVLSYLKSMATAINAIITAGSSTGTFGGQGNVNVQTTATGVQPAATGGDYVLATYSLPANAFDVAGRSLTITANGSFASNVNGKRVKIFVGCTAAVVGSLVSGGTAIADSNTVNTTATAGGWEAQASIYKYGATGSNTQLGLHQQFQSGNGVAPMLSPTALTMAENAPIIIAITGNAATATTDITFNQLEMNWND